MDTYEDLKDQVLDCCGHLGSARCHRWIQTSQDDDAVICECIYPREDESVK